MADKPQACAFPSPRIPVAADPQAAFKSYRTALVLGMVGAGAAALIVFAPWSIGLLGAAAILVLSAAESESFLLFLVFVLPIGWFTTLGEATVPYSRLDVATAVHLLATVGFFGGRLFRGRFSLPELWKGSISRASIVLTGVILLSLAFGSTGWTRDSSRSLVFFGSYVGFYFAVLVWVNSRKLLRKVCLTLLLSTILVALFAIFQEVVGGYTSLWVFLNPSAAEPVDPWSWRATSFLSQPNSLAGYLNLVLPFALACYVLGQGRWKKVGGLTVGLGFAAILSSQSVGGLMAFLSIIVLAIFCFARNRRQAFALFAGICALACLLYVLRDAVNPSHTGQALGPDAVLRLMFWAAAWSLFIHSPLIGVGWGNFAYLSAADIISVRGALAAHNIYLQFLAETGLMGLVAFFYLIVQSWRQAWYQLRNSLDFLEVTLSFGVLGALLSVLVHGFVDFLFQACPQFGTAFWVLLALLAASGRMPDKPAVTRVEVSGARA
jgi:hypothetical protein